MNNRFEASIVPTRASNRSARTLESMLENGMWVLGTPPVLQQVAPSESPDTSHDSLSDTRTLERESLEEPSVLAQISLIEPSIPEQASLATYATPEPGNLDEPLIPERKIIWKKVRRSVAVGAAAMVLSTLCVSDTVVKPGYEPPRGQIVNVDEKCPDNSQLTFLNVGGLGNKEIGIYAAEQEQNIIGDKHGICYAGFSYGSEYDTSKNAAVLHEMIEKNSWENVVVFAHSFGGIATIDMLNEYHRLYPYSQVEFSIAFFSSPAELDDLWPDRQFSVETLSIVPLTQDIVKVMTYLSIVGQGDKGLFDPQVLHDTNEAAKDTPAGLIGMEAVRIMFKMSRSDMKVPMTLVIDLNDEVVNTAKTIESIPRRTGQPLDQVIYMTHKDPRMESHAAMWWGPNNEDYRGSLEKIVDFSVKDFSARALAKERARVVTKGGDMRSNPR